jgi:hypothetical protein
VAGVDQDIDMITDGNPYITFYTVINIKRPKAGIVSDENNYLIIGVAVDVRIVVIMLRAICICLIFRKKGSRKTETVDAIELQINQCFLSSDLGSLTLI